MGHKCNFGLPTLMLIHGIASDRSYFVASFRRYVGECSVEDRRCAIFKRNGDLQTLSVHDRNLDVLKNVISGMTLTGESHSRHD